MVVSMVVSMVVGVATYASMKQYISDDELCSDQSCLLHELLQKEESSHSTYCKNQVIRRMHLNGKIICAT